MDMPLDPGPVRPPQGQPPRFDAGRLAQHPRRLLGLFAAVCMLAGWLLQSTPLDRSLFLALHGGPELAPWAWAGFSFLGTGIVAVLLCIAMGPRLATVTSGVLVAVIFGGLLVQALKLGLGAARPLAVLGPELVQPIGMALYTRSFPSGHSACAAAVAVIAGLFIVRQALPGWRWQLSALLSVAATVALSRVVVGAHWPADVLAGIGLGVGIGALVCLSRHGAALCEGLGREMQGRAGSRAMSALAMVLAGMVWVAPDESGGPLPALVALLGVCGAVRWWRHLAGHRSARPAPDAQAAQPARPALD